MSGPLSGVMEAQIASLVIDPLRPMVICDADEVLLSFVDPFDAFLRRQGLYLDMVSYGLQGNVRLLVDGTPFPVNEFPPLLAAFFEQCASDQPAVPGASDALAVLSEFAQIVILTNVPAAQKAERRVCLAGHGMDYPLIAGEGLKGAIVQRLVEHLRAPAVFIDDIHAHHRSVAQLCPDVFRLHLIADPKLARLAAKSDHCHERIDIWDHALPVIRGWLQS